MQQAGPCATPSPIIVLTLCDVGYFFPTVHVCALLRCRSLSNAHIYTMQCGELNALCCVYSNLQYLRLSFRLQKASAVKYTVLTTNMLQIHLRLPPTPLQIEPRATAVCGILPQVSLAMRGKIVCCLRLTITAH